MAIQTGQPVPTFSWQPRPRLDLSGQWRFEPATPNIDLALTDRTESMRGILAEAGGRQHPSYDDTGWAWLSVPGTFSPPPKPPATGGWYRNVFRLTSDFGEGEVVLKFGSVNYLADVWLNGTYLGYHEGGWTPFAFSVTRAIKRAGDNVVVVRVVDPTWGTRQDVVPWGLEDWWNYGGMTGPVWVEGSAAAHLVRADVTPHLDGADLAVAVQNSGPKRQRLTPKVEVLPVTVTEANVASEDPRRLISAGIPPVISDRLSAVTVDAGKVSLVHASLGLTGADLWSPGHPALYLLHVGLLDADQTVIDDIYETFGLRHIEVDPSLPQILLNGTPVAFRGVAIHNEVASAGQGDAPRGGPLEQPADVATLLGHARAVHADLIRADHHPANPILLDLSDRSGFAVWEELPLYHFTPASFVAAMARGIPQQMLAEMALRDFNHPSVLFHGLANESTGDSERRAALRELHQLDRRLDGTRLTGQAMYGSNPSDSSSADLDVAGFTMYYGIFYGGALTSASTAAALDAAHRFYPQKPVMVLEFGRWADSPAEQLEQARVFSVTYQPIATRLDTTKGGFIAGAVWWSLEDYWTDRPGVNVERFGMFDPRGNQRKVAAVAATAFGQPLAGGGAEQHIASGGKGVVLPEPRSAAPLLWRLAAATGFAVAVLTILLALLATPAAARAGRPAA